MSIDFYYRIVFSQSKTPGGYIEPNVKLHDQSQGLEDFQKKKLTIQHPPQNEL